VNRIEGRSKNITYAFQRNLPAELLCISN